MADVIRLPWPDLTKIDTVEELNQIMDARRAQVEQFLQDNAQRKELVIPGGALLDGGGGGIFGPEGSALDGGGGGGARPRVKTVQQVRKVYAPKDSAALYADADRPVLSKLTASMDVKVEKELWFSLPAPVEAAAGEVGVGAATAGYLQQIGADTALLKKETGQGVVVSIIDSGIDTSHAEFTQAGVQFNKHNSFDYYNDDAEEGIIVPIKLPAGKAYAARHYHGTAVAGLIAGKSAGVARGCTLTSHNILYQPSVKVRQLLQRHGLGEVTRSRLEKALMYATIHKADIFCLSLGVPGYDDRFRREIADAAGDNRLIVAASGNDGFQTHRSPGDYPQVLAVGAVDGSDKVWSKTSAMPLQTAGGSAYAHPDIYAPGVDLRLPVPAAVQDKGYIVASGTSFAAPLVAGAAALILAWHRQRDQPITAAQIKAHLLATADSIDIPAGAGGGKGKRLNVGQAMKALG